MKGIWQKPLNLESINKFNRDTLVSHIGIEVVAFGDDFLEATMPIDSRTVQPFQLLHGGASCVLSESLGSIAANLCLDNSEFMAVGQHIEATHLRPATKGLVKGRAKAIYIGKSTQTWRIEISDEEEKMICDSKIIMAIIKRK
ncbi:MAG: hotdog fold thioesterase [Bacteriovorax sp.]